MTKTEHLSELFNRWKSEVKFSEYDFYADGIINEHLYDECPQGKKLLFITKEPNASNHEKNEDRSFVTEWNFANPTYPFACRIAEWAYGILNDFPPFDEIPETKQQCLKQISFMNIKKSGGKGEAVFDDVYSVAIKQTPFILEQVNIIQPDIIITGLSGERIRNILWPDVKWKKSGYAVLVGRYKNAKMIDFYHPSSRSAPAASYSLLKNIIYSDSFRSL
jgi:hypothetical protein